MVPKIENNECTLVNGKTAINATCDKAAVTYVIIPVKTTIASKIKKTANSWLMHNKTLSIVTYGFGIMAIIRMKSGRSAKLPIIKCMLASFLLERFKMGNCYYCVKP